MVKQSRDLSKSDAALQLGHLHPELKSCVPRFMISMHTTTREGSHLTPRSIATPTIHNPQESTMRHMDIGPEEGSASRSSRASTLSTWFGIWERQPRLAKGLTCLVIGFLIGTSLTYLSLESAAQAPTSPMMNPTSSVVKKKVHSSGFGGINNIAQPAGAKAHAAAAAAGEGGLPPVQEDLFYIPTSNLGHAIPSLLQENLLNHRGHYVHDEHRSPYASHLYGGMTQAYLNDQQEQFVQHMEAVRREWGAWSDIEEDDVIRPRADFSKVPHGDLPNKELPKYSWQADEDYIGKLIPEARALIDRVTEGIYAEYGHPLKQKDGTVLSPEKKAERDLKFQIVILDPGNYTSGSPVVEGLNTKLDHGIAWLTKPAMDGLVRKLLHALISNDEFYVVLGGHSAAAGHGNNFMQNKIMAFHHIMEPVFDKLGMRLISRNMAMGGVGTLQFSMAGKALYGEADVMLWDSGMTEGGGTVDFFNKQAILAGERMPVLLTSQRFDVMKETKGEAWIGDFRVDTGILPLTVDEVQANDVPYAARYMHTDEPRLAGMEKYNAVCWEPRSDFTPLKDQDQKFGSQVGWHPGFRYHQYEGRLLTLVLLEGLKRALGLWEEGMAKDGFPLAEKYWHVGEAYHGVRELLRTHVNTEKEDGSPRSACETFKPEVPRICRVAMEGYGMWTPRVGTRNFLDVVKEAPNGFKPTYQEKMAYQGFDILPIVQKIPDGEVDVHAIAIATTNPPPDLNHEWIDDDDESSNPLNASQPEPPTRRWLRSATEATLRRSRGGMIDSSGSKLPLSLGIRTEKVEPVRSNRRLDSATGEEIIPGRGWELSGWVHTNGFCDGSSMSTCSRAPSSTCLASGHNDQHLELAGNSLSGWLVLTLPRVKEGIVLVRMEWWCSVIPTITKGWTEVNGGNTTDTTPYTQRQLESVSLSDNYASPNSGSDYAFDAISGVHSQRLLKPTIDGTVPQDFEMDYAIIGQIKTMNRSEWVPHTAEYSKNCAVWPLLNDDEMAKRENWDGEEMEVAIRFRSKENPHYGVCISHVYFA